MIPLFIKTADAASIENEMAVIQAVEQRVPGLALPYYRKGENKIALVRYPVNLTDALRNGTIDPCGNVIVTIVNYIKSKCAELYAANIAHYDMHTSNFALNKLGAGGTVVPDVRIIDWALSCDYASTRRPGHVRLFEVHDPLYDWYFFCFSLMQLYISLSVSLPLPVLLEKERVLDYKERMEREGHEWSRIEMVVPAKK